MRSPWIAYGPIQKVLERTLDVLSKPLFSEKLTYREQSEQTSEICEQKSDLIK